MPLTIQQICHNESQGGCPKMGTHQTFWTFFLGYDDSVK